MGCQVCKNQTEINISNLPILENKNKQNLNYLLEIDDNIEQNDKYKEKKNSSESEVSRQQVLTLKFDESNELEIMRESMFNEINLMRLNPELVIQKIEKYSPLIKTFPKYSYIEVDKNNKIKLNKGKSAFESCKNLFKNEKPNQSLILKNEFTFPFPDDTNDFSIQNQNYDFIKENYLTNALNNFKQHLIEKNLELINFHYDIMTSNIELSVLLQIVDDTGSFFHRRNNIFHKNAKYIGINIKKLEKGLYCYYLVFGKDIIKNN